MPVDRSCGCRERDACGDLYRQQSLCRRAAEFARHSAADLWLKRPQRGQPSAFVFLVPTPDLVANQQTIAHLRERGYVINGRKVWVANAEVADVAIVFAGTQPGARGRGISAFLVPMDLPGIARTPSDSLGVRGLAVRT